MQSTFDVAKSLQANILKPHGRNHFWLLFFRFPENLNGVDEFLELIIADNSNCLTHVQQTQSTQDHKRRKLEKVKKELEKYTGTEATIKELGVVNLSFSAEFYRNLEKVNKLGAYVRPLDSYFDLGISKINGRLPFYANDFKPPYRTGWVGDPVFFDLMLLVAHDEKEAVNIEKEKFIALAKERMNIEDDDIHEEEGKNSRAAYLPSARPLGYVDGISNRKSLTETGSLTLLREPRFIEEASDENWPGPPAYGTFQFFAKIGLNRKKFNDAVGEIAKKLKITQGDESGECLAKALLMGRFPNGTALALSKKEENPFAAFPFDYDEDPEGGQCPFQAHIRTVNPRKGLNKAASIVRRGGYYKDNSQDVIGELPPDGLLFISIQKSITDQLMPILRRMGIGGRTDAIAYAAKSVPFRIPGIYIKSEYKGQGQMVDIDPFVEYHGAEFLYQPSIRSLNEYIRLIRNPDNVL